MRLPVRRRLDAVGPARSAGRPVGRRRRSLHQAAHRGLRIRLFNDVLPRSSTCFPTRPWPAAVEELVLLRADVGRSGSLSPSGGCAHWPDDEPASGLEQRVGFGTTGLAAAALVVTTSAAAGSGCGLRGGGFPGGGFGNTGRRGCSGFWRSRRRSGFGGGGVLGGGGFTGGGLRRRLGGGGGGARGGGGGFRGGSVTVEGSIFSDNRSRMTARFWAHRSDQLPARLRTRRWLRLSLARLVSPRPPVQAQAGRSRLCSRPSSRIRLSTRRT